MSCAHLTTSSTVLERDGPLRPVSALFEDFRVILGGPLRMNNDCLIEETVPHSTDLFYLIHNSYHNQTQFLADFWQLKKQQQHFNHLKGYFLFQQFESDSLLFFYCICFVWLAVSVFVVVCRAANLHVFNLWMIVKWTKTQWTKIHLNWKVMTRNDFRWWVLFICLNRLHRNTLWGGVQWMRI